MESRTVGETAGLARPLLGSGREPRADIAEAGLDSTDGATLRPHHDRLRFGEIAAKAHAAEAEAVYERLFAKFAGAS